MSFEHNGVFFKCLNIPGTPFDFFVWMIPFAGGNNILKNCGPECAPWNHRKVLAPVDYRTSSQINRLDMLEQLHWQICGRSSMVASGWAHFAGTMMLRFVGKFGGDRWIGLKQDGKQVCKRSPVLENFKKIKQRELAKNISYVRPK